MFSFIAENLATILVGFVVLVIISAVTIKLVIDKKHHKSSCSGCSGCSCGNAKGSKCGHHG
jgi:hypothetical protein